MGRFLLSDTQSQTRERGALWSLCLTVKMTFKNNTTHVFLCATALCQSSQSQVTIFWAVAILNFLNKHRQLHFHHNDKILFFFLIL